jgi:SAM-dependent methyltransferase
MHEPRPGRGWDRYLLQYHDAYPGITEDVLADALDDGGGSPYDWVAAAMPDGATVVVDLACGSGPLLGMLGARRVVGVDRSAGELGKAQEGPNGHRLVRATASALPIASRRADAVVASMALMLLRPVEEVLAEVRRVLRPGGTLVATLPVRAATPGPAGAPAFADILGALGQAGADYPEPLHGPSAGDRLAAAGLTLLADDIRQFLRTVRGPDDAERVVHSFYAPGAGPGRVAAAVEELQRRVRAAPVDVTYRIRRLVAQR